MRAFYTTNNAYDAIVIPATMTGVQAGAEELRDFLSPEPNFDNWSGSLFDRMQAEGRVPGDAENGAPFDANTSDEELARLAGEIVAYRDDDGAVVIVDEVHWAGRLAFYGLSESA